MKKVLRNPLIIILITAAIFACGVTYGRHTAPNQIHIKEYIQEEVEESASTDANAEAADKNTVDDYLIADKINLNTATADVLMLLPGIGETFAQRIIAYRDQNGPYKSIDELMNIEGLGQKRVDDIRQYLCIDDG